MSATQLALKRCSKCGEEKPLDQYAKDKSRKDNAYPQCKACVNARVTKWKSTDAGKTAVKRYEQSEKGKATRKRGMAVHLNDAKNQIKRRARRAVAWAIKKGEMAPPSACQCNDCRNAPAVELHHHSYEPIHWLDVVPLCKACHVYRHANPESFNHV